MQYDNPKDFVFALVKYTAYAVPGHPVCYQIHIAHKDGNLDADGDPLLAPSLPKGVHRHHSGCYHIEDMPENPMRVIDLFIDLGYGWNEEFQKEQEFEDTDDIWGEPDNPDSMIDEIKNHIKWRTVQGMRKNLLNKSVATRKPPRLA